MRALQLQLPKNTAQLKELLSQRARGLGLGPAAPPAPSGLAAERTGSGGASSSSGNGSGHGAADLAARIAAFDAVLSYDVIDLRALRALAFHGVPDGAGTANLRPLVWKLLLGFLPPDTRQWEADPRAKRAQYALFCEELILDPANFGKEPSPLDPAHAQAAADADAEAHASLDDASDLTLAAAEVTHEDHPLCTHSSSKWATYFKDAEVLEQIDRDVLRTHPDMHFFCGSDGGAVQHRQEMKRALFVFAKLNPGLTYVQGMNELYAPLYYMLRRDVGGRTACPGCAEADSFFCFVDLVSEFRDNFCQQLDNSPVGVRAAMARLGNALALSDAKLAEHLDALGVKPQFYAFRWITLLLTQEFAFPEVFRIWDTLLSDPAGRADCLMRVCLAMLLNVREQLLRSDMSACIKLLQRYPPTDIEALLLLAEGLHVPTS